MADATDSPHPAADSPAAPRASSATPTTVLGVASCLVYPLQAKVVDEAAAREAVRVAFAEHRAFPLHPDGALDADVVGSQREQLIAALRGMTVAAAAAGSPTVQQVLSGDAHLMARLASAINLIHEALAEVGGDLLGRRFVLIRERPGEPCFYGEDGVWVAAKVGQGRLSDHTPTVYIGLRVFDVVADARRSLAGDQATAAAPALVDAVRWLLQVEERAIETGYSHVDTHPAPAVAALEALFTALLRPQPGLPTTTPAAPRRPPRITAQQSATFAARLNARRTDSPLDFDAGICGKAMQRLESLARRAKARGDAATRREVVRLLVAASGHDLHEVRNHANLLLERMLSPKPFDAPLARTFLNVSCGSAQLFDFQLPHTSGRYLLRLYRAAPTSRYPGEAELGWQDHELQAAGDGWYRYRHLFEELGHYDFTVVRASGRGEEIVRTPECNGRVNVIPALAGELVLQIFPDVHGHSRLFWDDREHPGLVYNEHGEVIRLGGFADITAHLERLQERYGMTAVYVLGALKRGSNREDWTDQATSASPFSPESLTEMEPSLGGNEGLIALVSRAHELGIRVIVDVTPHLNRRVHDVDDDLMVWCYDEQGRLVPRAATDGRYGTWNDGVLLNYRKLSVWEWLADSIRALIERFDLDGIRFDSAHAVPIMMKRDNGPGASFASRSHADMLDGTVVVNDREDDHFITTGYYDSACRDLIASPLHYLLMTEIERAARQAGKQFFVHLAEIYWGRERFLSRVGVIAYNSALFKICEQIAHGTSGVGEIYHLYDNYYRQALPSGTQLLGILGNHDERRPVNTFGRRNLRSALALTSFLSDMIMDFEGNAEGEAWKVFMDNIYVNWNDFENASDRSVAPAYRDIYRFHRANPGAALLLQTDNGMVVAGLKRTAAGPLWLGVFSFSERNESASVSFDRPDLPLEPDAYYLVTDPTYSAVTRQYARFTGRELRVSRLTTAVSYTDRVKLLRVDQVAEDDIDYPRFLQDSFYRLGKAQPHTQVPESFAFREIASRSAAPAVLDRFFADTLLPLFGVEDDDVVVLGAKRALYHAYRQGRAAAGDIHEYLAAGANGTAGNGGAGSRPDALDEEASATEPLAPRDVAVRLRRLKSRVLEQLRPRPLVFISAEAEPFSKSGGLANVAFELPRELVRLGEQACVITPLYRFGEPRAVEKLRAAIARHGITYSGVTVRFMLGDEAYEVGVHTGYVEGVRYFLLDHHEFFDGLYWGYLPNEKIRRRLALARAAAEVILHFELHPLVVATNDAAASLISGIVRGDPYYAASPGFRGTSFIHIIHNGGWQYFDCYDRFLHGRDLFELFNLPQHLASRFVDPRNDRLFNLMAAGIRFAEQVFTVSPSYARQIERSCDGIEVLLHDVIGINNGIGPEYGHNTRRTLARTRAVEESYPALLDLIAGDAELRDKVERRFPELLDGPAVVPATRARRDEVARMRIKLIAQLRYGLTVDPDQVLFAMIHRICDQKGFQLVLEASEGLFRTLGVQLIVGGPVAPNDQRADELAAGLRALEGFYPRAVAARIGYQDVSLPLLASDAFLMPSQFEPGGISQLEAMACGCLIVAHATGGLRDTIKPLQLNGRSVNGYGVLFGDFSPRSFYDAMRRCTAFLREATSAQIRRARVNAQEHIVYWPGSAGRYVREIYDMKEAIPAAAIEASQRPTQVRS